MSALYEVADLAVDLPAHGGILPRAAGGLNILAGISLAIAPAETFAVVGESGSGKTTLARTMMGLIRPSAGRLAFAGHALGEPGFLPALRQGAAMIFQDAVAALSPRMTVGRLLAEPFAIHRRRLPDPPAAIADLLTRVGLAPALAARYPHELSGGQARRVGVARALALGPRLVVADEPTAGLDVSVQGEILNLMAALRAELGLSLVFISHNLALVRHVADRTAILYLGRLAELGPTDAVFARPAHPYTASLIAAEPQPDPRRRRADLSIRGEIPSLAQRPQGCAFHTRCPRAAPLCRQRAPDLRPVAPGRLAACHFPHDT